MSKLVVRSFAVSLDGYAAGPDQSLELRELGAECTEQIAGERATHVFLHQR